MQKLGCKQYKVLFHSINRGSSPQYLYSMTLVLTVFLCSIVVILLELFCIYGPFKFSYISFYDYDIFRDITPHFQQQLADASYFETKRVNFQINISHNLKARGQNNFSNFFKLEKEFVVRSGQHFLRYFFSTFKLIEKNKIQTAALIFEGDGWRKITTSKYYIHLNVRFHLFHLMLIFKGLQTF